MTTIQRRFLERARQYRVRARRQQQFGWQATYASAFERSVGVGVFAGWFELVANI